MRYLRHRLKGGENICSTSWKPIKNLRFIKIMLTDGFFKKEWFLVKK